MSKSARALIQITVALVLAMVSGILIFMWTSRVTQQKTSAPAVAETVPVIVAKIDIKRGTKLEIDMLQTRQFTPDSRPSGAFSSAEEIEGRVLSTNVGGNEAVTASKLADPTIMGGGVSALIEPGKRAMSVKGNEVMGLSGFVRPGDRVDVIATMAQGRNDRAVTKLVLERVKVLATGTELTPPDKDGKTASVDVYTLEVTPREGERLALAATQGTLNFALRNEQDEEKSSPPAPPCERRWPPIAPSPSRDPSSATRSRSRSSRAATPPP